VVDIALFRKRGADFVKLLKTVKQIRRIFHALT
jgi:hypothetical protein